MEACSIDMCFTSPTPPFDKAKTNAKNVIGSENDTGEYVKNLVDIFHELKRVLKDTGSLFVQMGDYHYKGTLMATPELFVINMIHDGWFLRSKLIWHRTEHSPQEETNRFRRNWEYIFFFTKRANNYYFDNKGNNYYKNSVYSYPSRLIAEIGNEFDSGFPEELVEIAIKTTVPKNGVVLDVMSGTGKTGVVAKRLGRNFLMIDIDERLCDAMKARLKV
jgi:site-specific DNA-methyltransferase (adenine-specific)